MSPSMGLWIPACAGMSGWRVKRGSHLSAIADGAEMLVDAEYDQDVFRHDPRRDHADEQADKAGEDEEEAADRVQQHQSQPGKNAGQSAQYRDNSREPVKDLDDRGSDEPFPLKEVAKIEHGSSPLDAWQGRDSVRETAPAVPAGQLEGQFVAFVLILASVI